jgi:hypothetical protein
MGYKKVIDGQGENRISLFLMMINLPGGRRTRLCCEEILVSLRTDIRFDTTSVSSSPMNDKKQLFDR